jgi:hypothetical protein
MMAQTVLPFKLEITKDEISSQAGLALFGEFIHALSLPALLDRRLPGPGSPVGYQPSQFTVPLLLMLHGGGRSLEDLRQIRMDAGLRELLGLDKMPSSDATGDWLRRTGDGKGLGCLGRVNRDFTRRVLRNETETDYTLDIDASQVVAQKQDAMLTYKGERGYMPIVGHLAQNGLVIGEEFREGNDSPNARNLQFITYCARQMPTHKRIAHLRADSATYQADVFNWCEDRKVSFAIGGRLDEATQALIKAIPASAWQPYQDGFIAETVHSMEKTKKAFRLIVVKRPVQQELLADGKTQEDKSSERYKVIASNRAGESAEETLRWYNLRGESSENRIKDLKIGFGMERMPCGQFSANAVFFRIGVLAYNLFVFFKMAALPQDWRRCQVQTIRWRFYQIAGKVTHHAGRVSLKVREWMFALVEEVRAKCWELSRA